MRYGLGAKRNGMNFSAKESPWHFTDFWDILRTFFGHFTDFSVDCITNYKTKKVQQHQDLNRRPHAPQPRSLTTALLVHIENAQKIDIK
jgi:hypothetical protein